MKIYVLSSNKYAHICSTNIEMINKYWSNQQIVLLGYEKVLKIKNEWDNVEIVSLGNQSKYSSWSDGLLSFFKDINEKYFTLIFDDHILMNEVNKSKIEELEQQFKTGFADKAMIGGGIPLNFASPLENSNLLLIPQGVHYRSSLHPAIWTKEYFLKYLKPNFSSWDFELKNMKEAMFDGANVINYNYKYPESPHLYSYLELFNKGIISIDDKGNVLSNQPSAKFFDKKDLLYIWKNINKCQKELE